MHAIRHEFGIGFPLGTYVGFDMGWWDRDREVVNDLKEFRAAAPTCAVAFGAHLDSAPGLARQAFYKAVVRDSVVTILLIDAEAREIWITAKDDGAGRWTFEETSQT